jgi:sugar O-acyltransferase (sialic acid O-acetyltransferase NeuD family)
MPSPELVVYAVASPYAWDVVESCWRADLEPVCIDNIGGADPELPNLRLDGQGGRFVLGLSSADGRLAAARAAAEAGFDDPVVLIDPTAAVARTASLSHGVYVNAGAVVAAKAVIGCHTNINRSASVGHDNRLGVSVSIGPGAVLAGSVTVGAVAFIGAGATVLPGIVIGRRAVVGAGAVVTADVADGEVLVGNPAHVIRTLVLPEGGDACPHCSTS